MFCRRKLGLLASNVVQDGGVFLFHPGNNMSISQSTLKAPGVFVSIYLTVSCLQCIAIQQQSTAPQSGHALLTQVRSMCSWTLSCVSSLVPSVLHLSHGFKCSPTLNRQPYEGRLPLTSWWRKSSNMTVGQSSLIYLAHHCYDWHLGSRCG